MAIAINGKNSPAAISYNGHDVKEVYVGSRKVWPDENEFYIRVRPWEGNPSEWHYIAPGEQPDRNTYTELETGSLCSSINLNSITGSHNLHRLKLSDSTKELGDLSDFYELTSIDLGNGLERIRQAWWFHGSTSYDLTVTLPASIKEMPVPFTNGVSPYNKAILLATTPPTALNSSGDYQACMFYVPAESFDLYKVAPGWDNLYNQGYLHPIE